MNSNLVIKIQYDKLTAKVNKMLFRVLFTLSINFHIILITINGKLSMVILSREFREIFVKFLFSWNETKESLSSKRNSSRVLLCSYLTAGVATIWSAVRLSVVGSKKWNFIRSGTGSWRKRSNAVEFGRSSRFCAVRHGISWWYLV